MTLQHASKDSLVLHLISIGSRAIQFGYISSLASELVSEDDFLALQFVRKDFLVLQLVSIDSLAIQFGRISSLASELVCGSDFQFN